MPVPATQRTYSPGEICALFGVPKSTLFRWERETAFPRVPRDLDGQRIYRREHIEAICQKQLEQIRRSYERAAADEDLAALESLERALSFLKVVRGDPTGIRSMESRVVTEDDLRRLVEAAMEWYEPVDDEFIEILETVARLGRRLQEGTLVHAG